MIFVWLVFTWMLVACMRELTSLPADRIARLFVVLRVVVALFTLAAVLGRLGRLS